MSLLSRLFRRRPRKGVAAAPPSPGPPPTEALEALTAEVAAPSPPLEPVVVVAPKEQPAPLEPANEDVGDADEPSEPEEPADPAEEDVGPDPFVGSGEPLQIDLPTVAGVAAARCEAEALALSGPQRVTPNDPAGPGSLAETLAQLEAEGRLVSEVVDDPEEGLFILYRPVGRPPE